MSGALVGGTGPRPGAIEGVRYRSATQSGYTDGAGTFRYAAGETVTFSVGDVDFHPTPGRLLVSPWQLTTAGTCTASDELTRLLAFLYSLDTDGDAGNGTQVEPAPMGASQLGFATLDESELAARVQALGGDGAAPDGGVEPDAGTTPIAGEEALIEFIQQMDGEDWEQIGSDTFTGLAAEERSQGITTDGTHWIFSWQGGFQVTDQGYHVVVQNNLAIPPALLLEGIDHIGDCDFANGRIYAGTEDESHYQHPTIEVFDAQIDFQADFPISTEVLPDGCPWVAADAPNQRLLTSAYGDASVVDFFDMTTGAPNGGLTLSTTLHSVQGAKLFETSLYACTHDLHNGIYKVDLATGVVTPLFALGASVKEQEGCVFLARSDGSQLHTLDVAADGISVELRHHERTREPLRKSVCP